jgi:hypothetical protein
MILKRNPEGLLQPEPPLKLISGFASLLGLDLLPESIGV